MAYLLIPTLHQLVHQIDDLVRVDGVGTSKLGLREHGPILAASYDGANCGVKLLLAAQGDGLRQPQLISFALGLSISQVCIAF